MVIWALGREATHTPPSLVNTAGYVTSVSGCDTVNALHKFRKAKAYKNRTHHYLQRSRNNFHPINRAM
ncbi:hypothetical protein UPYG_G00307760 [Umbra pygmaea]|uniref:Uncharacterized protein n=1 Tax=Umbra pygmaea TaxID=75934 RepID=A0ABD0W3H4_UMBPY